MKGARIPSLSKYGYNSTIGYEKVKESSFAVEAATHTYIH